MVGAGATRASNPPWPKSLFLTLPSTGSNGPNGFASRPSKQTILCHRRCFSGLQRTLSGSLNMNLPVSKRGSWRDSPLIVEAVNALKVRSCLIDGEAVACDENGLAVFELLREKPAGRQHRGKRNEASSRSSDRHVKNARVNAKEC
jgi:hypothetical protein